MQLRRIAFAGCLLALSLTAAPARAVDPKVLPNDTEVVVTLNLKQILESDIAKANKDLIEKAIEGARSKLDESPAKKYLEKAGFDPFKHLHTITVAGPAAKDLDSGVIIVGGKFDVEKFNAAAEDAGKDNADALKVHTIGGRKVFEITPNGEKTIFASLVDDKTLVAAPTKDGLADGIARVNGNKSSQLKANLKAILSTVSDKQSISVALTSGALNNGLKEAPIPPNQDATETLKQVDAISLSITLGKNIEIAGAVIAKDVESAKKLAAGGNLGMLFVKGMAGQKVKEQPNLQPALDVLNTVRIADAGATVTMRAEISQDNLEKLLAILPKGGFQP